MNKPYELFTLVVLFKRLLQLRVKLNVQTLYLPQIKVIYLLLKQSKKGLVPVKIANLLFESNITYTSFMKVATMLVDNEFATFNEEGKYNKHIKLTEEGYLYFKELLGVELTEEDIFCIIDGCSKFTNLFYDDIQARSISIVTLAILVYILYTQGEDNFITAPTLSKLLHITNITSTKIYDRFGLSSGYMTTTKIYIPGVKKCVTGYRLTESGIAKVKEMLFIK